ICLPSSPCVNRRTAKEPQSLEISRPWGCCSNFWSSLRRIANQKEDFLPQDTVRTNKSSLPHRTFTIVRSFIRFILLLRRCRAHRRLFYEENCPRILLFMGSHRGTSHSIPILLSILGLLDKHIELAADILIAVIAVLITPCQHSNGADSR